MPRVRSAHISALGGVRPSAPCKVVTSHSASSIHRPAVAAALQRLYYIFYTVIMVQFVKNRPCMFQMFLRFYISDFGFKFSEYTSHHFYHSPALIQYHHYPPNRPPIHPPNMEEAVLACRDATCRQQMTFSSELRIGSEWPAMRAPFPSLPDHGLD